MNAASQYSVRYATIPIAALLALVSGCAKELSSKVAQDRIYTDYRLVYDDTSRELKGTATFYFGNSTGTFLELDGASQVTFDGTLMTKNVTLLNSVSYESTLGSPSASQLSGDHTFVYTNNDGVKYTNSLRGLGTLKSQYPASVSSAASLVFSWTSSYEWKKDWLQLRYSGRRTDTNKDVSGSEPVPIPSYGATTGVVTVTADHLKAWGPGAFKVQICRETSDVTLAQATAAGGAMSAKTCDSKSEVKVTP